jgi:hypothetical protein
MVSLVWILFGVLESRQTISHPASSKQLNLTILWIFSNKLYNTTEKCINTSDCLNNGPTQLREERHEVVQVVVCKAYTQLLRHGALSALKCGWRSSGLGRRAGASVPSSLTLVTTRRRRPREEGTGLTTTEYTQLATARVPASCLRYTSHKFVP